MVLLSSSPPPPLFSPSPSPSPSQSPSPPCSPSLRRFFSSTLQLPISSQELISNDDSSLLAIAVVHYLDGFHQFTGLPWWMIIASSTVAVRLALLPLLILQLKKLKKISELLPQLPMPIPEKPTLKGSIDQFCHFLKESRAIGCPSFLWFFPYLSVQFIELPMRVVDDFILYTRIESFEIVCPGFSSCDPFSFRLFLPLSFVVLILVVGLYPNAAVIFRSNCHN